MPRKAFLEITNACNLACDFCHGTKRAVRFMTAEEFSAAASALRSFADYLYFHVMGEPLLHPELSEFLTVSASLGFKVILTTNGTLLPDRADELLAARNLHKVSISLHCYEANAVGIGLDDYLAQCFDFCAAAAERGIIAVMRLWNIGGGDSLNERILAAMSERFSGQWKPLYSGYRIAERTFLEWGEKFEWPDIGAPERGGGHSCYGIRDQIGVLCDGTVVPCCLDADGSAALGNIFETELDDILSSPRALSLKQSFERRNVTEDLCRRCGYASARWT